jgi:hypothetical protein
MKIKPTHYRALAVKVNKLLDKHPEVKKSELLASMRKRWDVYWASGGAFTNASEYHYLDDSNIDAALKDIIKKR